MGLWYPPHYVLVILCVRSSKSCVSTSGRKLATCFNTEAGRRIRSGFRSQECSYPQQREKFIVTFPKTVEILGTLTRRKLQIDLVCIVVFSHLLRRHVVTKWRFVKTLTCSFIGTYAIHILLVYISRPSKLHNLATTVISRQSRDTIAVDEISPQP